MPELAEIKIMSEYVNSQDFTFTEIFYSDSAIKRKLTVPQIEKIGPFKIYSESRGKELRLFFKGEKEVKMVHFSMGMSGEWAWTREFLPKHTHIAFKSGEEWLCLVDVRRFAKWKASSEWSSNRGPCPLHEYSDFIKNIENNLKKSAFKKSIAEVLMDQRYFNGIGNYLRAEILFKANQNPFTCASEALLKNPKILSLCKQLPYEAYLLGGGQLKDWSNPFQISANNFSEWIQCYGISDNSIIDSNGRRLWYWSSQIN